MIVDPELHAHANLLYEIDRAFTVVSVNAAYQSSPRGPGAAAFLRRWGIGASALAAISADLRPFYRGLFERAFTGECIEHRYECPLPSRFRTWRMRLLPAEDRQTVLVEHALVAERDVPGALHLDDEGIVARYEVRGVIVQCSHCRKARAGGPGEPWEWVSALVARPWPQASHGLCPVCLAHFYPAPP